MNVSRLVPDQHHSGDFHAARLAKLDGSFAPPPPGAEGEADAQGGAAKPLLVNTTKLLARPSPPRVDRSAIVARYYLQSLARKLLGRDKDFDRLNVCHRCLSYGEHVVKVMYSGEQKRARFKNLAVCGSVWLCALCAGRITEGRRIELAKAIEQHHDNGGSVYFSTLTIPHTSADSLQPFQAGFVAAEKLFRDSRFFRALKASGALLGTIRAAEVTHWLNGWHYHAHMLWFLKDEVEVTRVIRRPGYAAWVRAVRRAGFSRSPSYQHGFYVAPTYGAVDDYIAKYGQLPKKAAWGPESEMTKGYQKRGRLVGGQSAKHRSPFEILGDWGRSQNPRDAALFIEYARAFRGRQQLRWSPGLRKSLLPDVADQSDLSLADASLPYERLLGRIFISDWEKILKHDQRGQVIDVASAGDWAAVRAFIDGLGVA